MRNISCHVLQSWQVICHRPKATAVIGYRGETKRAPFLMSFCSCSCKQDTNDPFCNAVCRLSDHWRTPGWQNLTCSHFLHARLADSIILHNKLEARLCLQSSCPRPAVELLVGSDVVLGRNLYTPLKFSSCSSRISKEVDADSKEAKAEKKKQEKLEEQTKPTVGPNLAGLGQSCTCFHVFPRW